MENPPCRLTKDRHDTVHGNVTRKRLGKSVLIGSFLITPDGCQAESKGQDTPGTRIDSVPPVLIKTRASMYVATTDLGSIPNSSIAGTIISEVLPVITLTTLVRKTTMARAKNSGWVRPEGSTVILMNSSSVFRPTVVSLF